MSSPTTSPSPPPPTVFIAEANRFLSTLSRRHATHLSAGDDAAVLTSTRVAATVRRATVVYVAATDILPAVAARDSPRLAREAAYLRGLVCRLWEALRARDPLALVTLSDAAQAVLDGFQAGGDGLFEEMEVVPLSVGGAEVGLGVGRRRYEVVAGDASADATRAGGHFWDPYADPSQRPSDDASPDVDLGPDGQDLVYRNGLPRKPKRVLSATQKKGSAAAGSSPPPTRRRRCSLCGLSFSDLSPRDKLVLWLYLLMILFALMAVTAVTVDFARQQINPGAFIRSSVTQSLPAPVITVCLSQRGVPFSRLQLFNYTDAEGRNLVGADPLGPQKERQSRAFEAAVDRFWDNPDNEDCDKIVGDFFPFPLISLNRLTAGEITTKCRPCYRVGRKEGSVVRSTDFQDSSVLSFYTDNYFLQCMKSVPGLNEESLEFLHLQVEEKRQKMQEFGVLSVVETDGRNVVDLKLEDFATITPKQACNIFYFSFFPKALKRDTDNVSISYEYNGTAWNEKGTGPYFNLRESQDFLPEESLQMFVGTNESTKVHKIGVNRDMILIGPNTQTFATFRPVVVYGTDRYDISSSTSNLMQSNVEAIFGYWLVYRIFYNYNRFVTDEWYRESTYPASQWIVDLTGYASLFTGASLFSLLLLPLLRAMRKREKQRLIKQQPEVYLWSQHKQRYQEAAGVPAPQPDISEGGNMMRGSSVMLPGYNV